MWVPSDSDVRLLKRLLLVAVALIFLAGIVLGSLL